MTSIPDTGDTFFIAYWPCEGGAQPLRLGRNKALAVWLSAADVETYALRTRAVLQPVRVTRAELVGSEETLHFQKLA